MTVSNTTLPSPFETSTSRSGSAVEEGIPYEVRSARLAERQPAGEVPALTDSGDVDELELRPLNPAVILSTVITMDEPEGVMPALVLPDAANIGVPAQPANLEVATSASVSGEPFEETPSGPVNGPVAEPIASASSEGTAPTVIKPETKHWLLKSDKKVWSTGFWPFAAAVQQDTVGNPDRNLWASNGCLDKFDRLLAKRGLPGGARDHELVPALNFLRNDGTPSGYYVPGRWVREDNAEITTGVDFNGNGQLDNLARVDFLDDNQMFGQNGRTDGILDVGWWGSCDQVALAGLLFEEPLRDVTIDGITFTRQDIKGLLTVIAGSQASEFEYTGTRFMGSADRIVLQDGTVHFGRALNITMNDCLKSEFERFNGNQLRVKRLAVADQEVRFRTTEGSVIKVPVSEVALLEREDKAEPSASDFHQTVKRWLREGRPFAMDRDPGEHIWNVNVDQAEIWKNRKKSPMRMPTEVVGFNGPAGDGDICYYKTVLRSNAFIKDYYYWIEKRDGEHVNSGWIMSNPAFLWRPTVSEPTFEGENQRNPFVTPELVKTILRKSTLGSVEYYKEMAVEFADWMGLRFF